jgi:DNA polymerase, archaea type
MVMVAEQEGFIIYPTYRVENNKAYVYLFGRLKNGKSFCTKSLYEPYFFIKSSDVKKISALKGFLHEETQFKDFEENLMTKIKCTLPSEVPELRKLFENKNADCFEADIKFPYRFMMDKNILGSISIKGEAILQKDVRVDLFFDEPEITPGNYKPEQKELKILALDIETSMNTQNLFCISLCSNDEKLKKVLIVSDKKIKHAESFKNEKELLKAFRTEIIAYDPDVITGWNVIDFDLAVLEKFMKKYEIKFDLGRTEEKCKLKIIESFMMDSKADFPGRMVLDGIHLLKTSFVKLEDYKLGTAAKAFTKKEKLIDEENKGEEIETSFENNPQKLADYNLMDSELVIEIIEKSGSMQLTILRSILTGMPLDRVRASIASLDSLYLRKLKERGHIAPSSKFADREERTTGGYVMNPKPGIYDYVLVFDFKSLYPSIMRTFNIDPLMFRGAKKIEKERSEKEISAAAHTESKTKIKTESSKIHVNAEGSLGSNPDDLIVAPNGAMFSKEKGILPEILDKLWAEREIARKKKDELTRWAIKILMNSMYGVMASPNCRFYSTEIANAITSFGHQMIKGTAKLVEEKGYEVIYGDSVAKDTEIIIRDKQKRIDFKNVCAIYKNTDKVSAGGKEYCFLKDTQILTLDKEGKSVFKSVKYVMRHKTQKKVYRVYFTNYWYIDVTEDHSLIGYINKQKNNNLSVMNRLIEIKPSEIKKKVNTIVSIKRIPNKNIITLNYPTEVYEFMGYFIGDGSFQRNKAQQKNDKDYYLGLSLGKDGDEIFSKLINPLIKMGYIKNYWWSKTRKGDIKINGLKLINIISKDFRDEQGKKTIPEWLLYEKDENICAFLRGLFSADGCVIIRNNAPIIKVTSVYDEHIDKIRKLLHIAGISHSVFKENNVNKYEDKNKGIIFSKGSLSKNITLKNKEDFVKNIGFLLERKNKLASIKTNALKNRTIKNYDFDLSSVLKIEEIKYDDYVYDVEVEDTHRFFANNVLVHNTDSIFVHLKVKNNSDALKIGKELEEEINIYYDKKIKKDYGVTSSLELEFEKTFIRFFMPKVRGSEEGAKKRYAGLLLKGEKETMDFTGLEFVRRDWTELAKKFQLELLEMVFHHKDPKTYIKHFIDELKKGKYDNLLVYRKALRKDTEEYTKTTPPHVKAARLLDKITSNIIDYVMTKDGPEPIQKITHELDYEHYIDKQIKPLADAILYFYDTNFDDIVGGSSQKNLGDW